MPQYFCRLPRLINAFLDHLENEQAFADIGCAIPEGSRNSTMSRIGARIIKRYGDTPEAKDLFFQAAQQCSPPLEDRELESIWAGKQRLYAKICKQPGYIPPDAYNSTGPVVWDTPIPFDEYDLPIFPVDALPEVIRRYVLAVAESTQTAVDMAAVEALGVVSLCSQGKCFYGNRKRKYCSRPCYADARRSHSVSDTLRNAG